jgi:hypothetical protein
MWRKICIFNNITKACISLEYLEQSRRGFSKLVLYFCHLVIKIPESEFGFRNKMADPGAHFILYPEESRT